jgi:hypothetical protein
MQHRRRLERDSSGIHIDKLTQAIEQRLGNGEPNPDSFLISDVGQRSFDLAAQMEGDSIGRLGGPRRPPLRWEPMDDLAEASLQSLGDQRLIKARTQLVHGTNLRPSGCG